MATNPMQRKANNYLLIGVLVTLLITGSIIAILFMQLNKLNTQIKQQEANMKKVYVVSKDIKSGESVKIEDLKSISVVKDAIPSNTVNIDTIKEETIAKIELKAGMVLTTNMLDENTTQTTNDLRIQEYNTIELPTQIENDDYIDIRLRLPNGTDYIVVSKKKVEIPQINGTDSLNTIRINVAEQEILLMSNAIVESYLVPGSKLYVTKYAEPGMQESATPTYLPSNEVVTLMNADPNIVTVAKNELFARYNSTSGVIRGNIVNSINANAAEGKQNIESGVQQEITKAREQRQSYLDALGGY